MPSGSLVGRLSDLDIRCESLQDFADSITNEIRASWDAISVSLYLSDEADKGPIRVSSSGALRLAGLSYELDRSERERLIVISEDERLVALPLIFQDELLGNLEVRFPAAPPVSLEELHAVCVVVTFAIHLRGVHRKLRSATRRARAMRELSAKIMTAIETVPPDYLLATVQRGFQFWPTGAHRMIPEFLVPLLQSILDQARSVVEAEFGALGIGTNPEEPFSPWVTSGVSEDVRRKIGRDPRPVGVLGYVARECTVLRVADIRKHPAFGGLPQHHMEIKSLLGIPVRYGSVCLGNLYLANKVGETEFSEEDEAVAIEIANYAAVALLQAFLHGSLEIQEAQIQTMLDSAPNGIIFVENHSDRVVANPRAMEIMGHSLSTQTGRQQYRHQIHSPDGRILPLEDFPSTHALQGRVTRLRELLVKRPDDTFIPILVSAAPVLSLQKKVIGAIVMVEEITAQKDLERLREEFSAMVVHDLRTPLQAALSQIEILIRESKGETTNVSKKALQEVSGNLVRLGRMIGDQLEVIHIETQKMSLDLKRTDVLAELRGIIDRIQSAYPDRTIEIHPELDADDRILTIQLDPVRFEQIIVNLLENALKCSNPPTAVKISVKSAKENIIIAIQDEGSGISEKELPLIFDKFFQAETCKREKKGLGLGLYIVKHLVALHGGSVWAESKVGKGSTFYVSLPRRS